MAETVHFVPQHVPPPGTDVVARRISVPTQQVEHRHQGLFQALAAGGEQGNQHGFFDGNDVLGRRFLHVEIQECHALGEKFILGFLVLELDELAVFTHLPGVQESFLNVSRGDGLVQLQVPVILCQSLVDCRPQRHGTRDERPLQLEDPLEVVLQGAA
jgi:hypothetical protein